MDHQLYSLINFQREVSKYVPEQAPAQKFEAGNKAAELRCKLIEEEADELCKALREEDAEAVLKEICDLLYVTLGTSVIYNFPLTAAFNRVHANNMAKLKSVTIVDGKVKKPADWPKPDLSDLVNESKSAVAA